MKTADLRKLINSKLKTINPRVYYQQAPDAAEFPYLTFDFDGVNFYDEHRDDITLLVDVWDHGDNHKRTEELADKVEALLNNHNAPTNTILPTFYRESRFEVFDQDKTIKHKQLKFYINMFEYKKK